MVYHSHPHDPARPSITDIKIATDYEDIWPKISLPIPAYLLISLMEDEAGYSADIGSRVGVSRRPISRLLSSRLAENGLQRRSRLVKILNGDPATPLTTRRRARDVVLLDIRRTVQPQRYASVLTSLRPCWMTRFDKPASTDHLRWHTC